MVCPLSSQGQFAPSSRDSGLSELAYGHGTLHANFCHMDCVLNIQGKLKILRNCHNRPEGGNGGGKLGKRILSCSPHRLCTIINGFPKVVPRYGQESGTEHSSQMTLIALDVIVS